MKTFTLNQVADVFMDEFSSWYNWKFKLTDMPEEVRWENVVSFSNSCHALLRLFPDKKDGMKQLLTVAPENCWVLKEVSKEKSVELFFS